MGLLDIHGLSTRLASEAGWVHALDDLSLAIEKGQTFALVGESGCGKSMTALSIARLLPDSGAIVAGQVRLSDGSANTDMLRISETAMRSLRGKRISMIFQEPGTSLNPVMTVGDQLTEMICLHTGASKAQALQEAEDWLAHVGIPEPKKRLQQFPFEMSGGQKQRVMIAMALCVKPDLLIADEPTTALDVSIQAQVLELLKTLQREQGMAMLLITHDLAIVKQMADTVGLMYAGQLVEKASTAEFFANPRHPYAHALVKSLPSQAQRGQALYALEGRVPSLVNPQPGCRFAARCMHVQENCTQSTPGLFMATASHEVRCFYHADLSFQKPASVNANVRDASTFGSLSKVVLQTVSLSVAYPEKGGLLRKHFKPVLNKLDVTLLQGRTVALVGESGSGKTTAARALLGLLGSNAKVQGDVLMEGRPLRQWPERGPQGWRSKIQFVFQDPFASLNPRHRIAEILEEPLLSLRPDLDAAARKARVLRVIEQVSMLDEVLTRFPHEFSGGQRQRIAIARALVSEPKILICDEPTSALDVSVQAQILNLLKRLQNETGVAMLFITHNLAVVQYLADEVVVLRHGDVVERGSAELLFANPQHAYTRQLINAAPVL
ncbi:MAG: dipeptide ABC transporter ATP-binding protein [Gammaproteobacteria bacterium]|uniref:ABC transporter ATP-binding protein n=1 Tax=Limnobacter sp. TaxID=2003368 RepID=UPI001DA8239C|nr:dipeptide ABC transporter ATP-binding protein [Limnobacter sp.]MBU0782803.1 dipeptide ABC transporter ATP-binding protein [Gammaproteobacteria bacterium]MBU0849390.1 dipeptide ABC transporter ATP-binding protein [Gammaproteobacteria bacterium]MBU1266541.1 dipeptide ABC transporter ATP-binding protein [Gammaproteobacteria bacterium]MBU1527736.1 dipeptide ABC transporter ATP-binding protein [Gammaproteobacteria bacterium]MBU1779589.1 dipeptide ABC transporter ATP-binding protein [Gammaproteob